MRIAPAWTSGTLLAEGSVDGTNFDEPLVFENPLTGAQSATISPADASVIDYLIPNAGLAKVRVRATAIVLGGKAGASIVLEATSAVGGPLAGQLPASVGSKADAASLSVAQSTEDKAVMLSVKRALTNVTTTLPTSVAATQSSVPLGGATSFTGGILMWNSDTTLTIFVGLGMITAAAGANKVALGPGQGLVWPTGDQSAIQVIAASGGPILNWLGLTL